MSDNLVSIDALSGALSIVLIETVAALSPSSKHADERLEEIASRLMTFEAAMTGGDSKRLLAALVRDLVSTEDPGAHAFVELDWKRSRVFFFQDRPGGEDGFQFLKREKWRIGQTAHYDISTRLMLRFRRFVNSGAMEPA